MLTCVFSYVRVPCTSRATSLVQVVFQPLLEYSVPFNLMRLNGKGSKGICSINFLGGGGHCDQASVSIVDLKAEIDKLATEYMSSARSLNSEEKLALLKQIQEAYGKCKEFGDDKVQLAMQTYEMVDKHIRRLDTDLARFEADLKEKQIESSDYDSSSSKGKKKGRVQKEKKAARARSKGKNSDEEAPKAAQKKLKFVRTSPEYGMPSVTFGSVHPSDVLDMPVDPNEPTYCLCHQVSYGEMIGCDNPDCSIEWFHFACVGLTTKPRGKWFCPRCSQERKKK
uniref:Inhibitor of growth protein n=1 Tax=Sarcophilus harrisii TaxID=9305 RepID=A0A7N4P0G9_SARHA